MRHKQKRFLHVHHKGLIVFMIRLKNNKYLTVFQLSVVSGSILLALFCVAIEGEDYKKGFYIYKHGKMCGNCMRSDPIAMSFLLFNRKYEIRRSWRAYFRNERNRIRRMYGDNVCIAMNRDGKLMIMEKETGVKEQNPFFRNDLGIPYEEKEKS
jgi:hypothetical protein